MNDGGYVFDDSGKIVGIDKDYKPRLLDTPTFAAATLRAISNWLEWSKGWAMTPEMAEKDAAFLRQIADEIEGESK